MDMLAPPGELGSRECQVMAILNSPEFDENLKIAMAKAEERGNTSLYWDSNSAPAGASSSSSSSTTFPATPVWNRERKWPETSRELTKFMHSPNLLLVFEYHSHLDCSKINQAV